MSARRFHAEAEPEPSTCRTIMLRHDMYRCVANDSDCNYGISAGNAGTFCVHPLRDDYCIICETRQNPGDGVTVQDSRRQEGS